MSVERDAVYLDLEKAEARVLELLADSESAEARESALRAEVVGLMVERDVLLGVAGLSLEEFHERLEGRCSCGKRSFHGRGDCGGDEVAASDDLPEIPSFAEGTVDVVPSLVEEYTLPAIPEEDALPTIPEDAVPVVEVTDLGLFRDVGAPPAPREEIVWTEEQLRAAEAVDAWLDDPHADSLFALAGPAGSGKTSLAKKIVEERGGFTLTAMTGKAAFRLAEVVGQSTSTLHSRLYFPPLPGYGFTRMREPPSSYVLVDEVSMSSPQVISDLRQWGVRALLLGDSYQLPPVMTGRELKEHGEDYSCFAEVRGVSLETVMRSAGGVLRAATRLRESGKFLTTTDLDAPGSGFEMSRQKEPLDHAVAEYLERGGGQAPSPDEVLLITWRNAVRLQANRVIRKRIGRGGPLPDPGEPVLLKKNGQFRLNGEVVVCGGFEDGPKIGSLRTCWMRVGETQEKLLVTVTGGDKDKGGEMMDGKTPWVEDLRKYEADLKRLVLPEPIPITWAYAISAHSAQGSESKDAIVFLGRGDERSEHFSKETTLPDGRKVPFSSRFVYTAITRAKRYAKMVVGR